MDREPGHHVAELLAAAEVLPACEREPYLAQACPDPEVRKEVLSLLEVGPESTGYLDHFAELVAELAPNRASQSDLTGKRIGAYRLLRPLGRGGMGVVYEAERADGAFEQRVALKLLTTALAGTEAHDRFLAERRILAGLGHPAIAHIVDGGVTEDGTPWFAMERVEGEPIDTYCDRRRLGVGERLELFLQVCDAVDHAHRRLVVHRDLKPTNVFVTEAGHPSGPEKAQPGSPQVKLLDFGIARLFDPEEPTVAEPPIRTVLRMMTPEYASPEQVRGDPVTTASDVYQLGLLLYELLTGHRPYVLRRRTAGEIEHVICHQVPTRLSAAIFREDTLKRSATTVDGGRRDRHDETVERAMAGGGVAAEEVVCQARSSSPTRLRRSLRGDLENITAKALSKEPEHRYGSADRLAQDIRRHLEGQPVKARPATWLYRSRKFLERHAVGVITTSVALAFAVGTTSIAMVRIQGERDRVEAQRDRAEAEATRADQVVRFLIGLFRGADPLEAQGAELSARELLDRGVAQVDRELAAQPDVQAAMWRVLGRTYLELGLYESAEAHLGRALEISGDQLDADHPDLARILTDLGLLRYRQGRYALAQDLLEDAKRILAGAATPGDEPSELAELLEVLGHTYRALGEYEKSSAALEHAVAIRTQTSGESSLELASSLHSLGHLLAEVGGFERADELYQRALAIYEGELGEDDPRVGHVLMSLAANRTVHRQLEGVEAMFRRSATILEAAYGPNHVRVAQVLSSLGNFLSRSSRFDEAIEVLQRALDVQIAATGPGHADLAYPLTSLGAAQLAAGHLHDARRSFRRTVAIRQSALEGRVFDPILVHSLVEIGRIEAGLGDDVGAEQQLESALEHWQYAPEAIDPQLAPALRFLGRWLTEQKRCTEATPLLQRAHRIELYHQAPSSSTVSELEELITECS